MTIDILATGLLNEDLFIRARVNGVTSTLFFNNDGTFSHSVQRPDDAPRSDEAINLTPEEFAGASQKLAEESAEATFGASGDGVQSVALMLAKFELHRQKTVESGLTKIRDVATIEKEAADREKLTAAMFAYQAFRSSAYNTRTEAMEAIKALQNGFPLPTFVSSSDIGQEAFEGMIAERLRVRGDTSGIVQEILQGHRDEQSAILTLNDLVNRIDALLNQDPIVG